MLGRGAFVFGLITFAVVVVWLEGGLIDSQTGKHPSFLDCVYYMIITVTTVGYGDIVPVTTFSRLTDVILLTPIRFIIIFTFIGTAYEFFEYRLRRDWQMQRAIDQLDGHIIIAGFVAAGQSAARELLEQGTPGSQIAVLSTNQKHLEQAEEMGLVALQADPAREQSLAAAAIDRASYLLVAPGRDDTSVLVCLTARDLNPKITIIAMCCEGENEKLLERSSANVIVSPTESGGTIMAAATRQPHLVDTMQELMSVRGLIHMDERLVTPDEAGKHPKELEGIGVVRLFRRGKNYEVDELPLIEAGDLIVYVTRT